MSNLNPGRSHGCRRLKAFFTRATSSSRAVLHFARIRHSSPAIIPGRAGGSLAPAGSVCVCECVREEECGCESAREGV